MRFGKTKDREAFGQIAFQPRRKFRGGLEVFLDRATQITCRRHAIGCVENGSDVRRDLSTHFLMRHIGLRILLQMKLAALPGNAAEHCLACGFESGMVVADDQLHAAQAACDQTLQKGAVLATRDIRLDINITDRCVTLAESS